MSKKSITKDIIEQLNNDIVPEELIYTVEPALCYDPTKLWFNEYYKSFEYAASKFPDGWQSIPGFDKVIQHIADNNISPFDEIELRKNINLNNSNTNGNDTSLSQ
jgi:hypothetical protein